ncbi:hypothetical protein ACQY0O_004158 [Thecaphora frezii]
MRLQLALLIAVQVALVGLVCALEKRTEDSTYYTFVDYNSESSYHEITDPSQFSFEDKVALQYKPWIRIENGCDLYPAVFGEKDNKALFSGGLENGGKASAGCRNRRQKYQHFYARWGYTSPSNKTLAVMHFWQAAILIHNVTQDEHGTPTKSEPVSLWWTPGLNQWGGKRLWKGLKPQEKVRYNHVKLKMFFDDQSTVAHLGTTGQRDGRLLQVILWNHFSKTVKLAFNNFNWNRHGSYLSDAGFQGSLDRIKAAKAF